MLEQRFFRDDINLAADLLKKRGFELDKARINKLESTRKTIQVETQELQSQRNTKSKCIGQEKSKGNNATELLAEVSDLGHALKEKELELSDILNQLRTLSLNVPNIPHDSVPEGKDENDNQGIKKWGILRCVTMLILARSWACWTLKWLLKLLAHVFPTCPASSHGCIVS